MTIRESLVVDFIEVVDWGKVIKVTVNWVWRQEGGLIRVVTRRTKVSSRFIR